MTEVIGKAITKDGQVVDAILIQTKGWWVWKRYLVSHRTRYIAHDELILDGVKIPPREEHEIIEAEWVKNYWEGK